MRALILLAAVVCVVAQNTVDTDVSLTAGADPVNIDFQSGEIVRLDNIPASAILRLNKGNAATTTLAQPQAGYTSAGRYDIIYTAAITNSPATYLLPAFTTEEISSTDMKVMVQYIPAANSFNQVATAAAGSASALTATSNIVLTKDSNENIYRASVQIFTIADPATAGHYTVCTVTRGASPATECVIEGPRLLIATVTKAGTGTFPVVFYSNANDATVGGLTPVGVTLGIWVSVDLRGEPDVTVNLKSDVPQARFTGGITAPTADIADVQIAGFGRVESSPTVALLRENPSSVVVPSPNDNNIVTIETTGISMNGLYALIMENDTPTEELTADVGAAATFAAGTRSIARYGNPAAGSITATFDAESTALMNADTTAFPATAGYTLPSAFTPTAPLVSFLITYSAAPNPAGTVTINSKPAFVPVNQKYSLRVLRCTPGNDGICPAGTAGVAVPTSRRPDGTILFLAAQSGIYTVAMVSTDAPTRTLTATNGLYSDNTIPTNTPVNLNMGTFSLTDFTCTDAGLVATVTNQERDNNFVDNSLPGNNKIGGFRTLTTTCNSFTTGLRDTYTVAELGSNTASTVTFASIPDSPASGATFTIIPSGVNAESRTVTSTNAVTSFSIFGLFGSGANPSTPTPSTPGGAGGGGTNTPATPSQPSAPGAPSSSGASYLLPTVSAVLLSVAALLSMF